MPFCPHCGASAAAAYCSKCGGKVSSGFEGSSQSDTGLTDNVAGALCYLGWIFTAIIFLILPPYSRSRNVRFHAFQSLFLTIAWVLANTFLALLLPAILRGTIRDLVQLAGILLWLFLMWKTYNNERVVLPIIGPLAEKQS